MAFEKILSLIKNDMVAVNQVIVDELKSNVSLIDQIGYHIIGSGGKRIRPMVAILVAHALNYTGTDHIKVAALIEFIHTATLLHDDVVDESHLRRGKVTANSEFGNAASVLVGDFIYTRAFQMMTSLNSLTILKIMSDATNVIAEGEVQQLLNCNDPNITEENYFNVIYSKTAKLFQAASHIGAVLANSSTEHTKKLSDYGRYLGTTFQLIDDLLDYTATSDSFGKKPGADLSEGKPTLPIIHALKHATVTERRFIQDKIEKADIHDSELITIVDIMTKYGSLDYTQQKATDEANKAIQSIRFLPETPYKEALTQLAKLSVVRTT